MIIPRLLVFLTAIAWHSTIHAQAVGVPVYAETRGQKDEAAITRQANTLREQGMLVSMQKVNEQMKRASCELSLPPVSTKKLNGREIWQQARRGHLRVGWHYLCTKCNNWHLNLAGGYVISSDGAVATCAHVIEQENMREGYLIAVTDEDKVLPVTEVLAAGRSLDTCILRVKADKLDPLPLSTEVFPGDKTWCFSEPLGRRGYFSEGIVNRFTRRPFITKKNKQPPQASAANGDQQQQKTAAGPVPVWIEVSTDWAPGSSGAALLDECGNAVGHVSEIEPIVQDMKNETDGKGKPRAAGTWIIFHEGIAAQNVLSLIKRK